MGQRLAAVLFSLGVAAFTITSAQARNAIAFSQAPEMSSGTCVGKSIRKALDCAKKQCVDGGGTAEDCLETTACFPAGWSIDIFVQQKDGPHWHEVHCGFDSKETALQASKSVCDRKRRKDLIECSVVTIYNEDGKALEPPAE